MTHPNLAGAAPPVYTVRPMVSDFIITPVAVNHERTAAESRNPTRLASPIAGPGSARVTIPARAPAAKAGPRTRNPVHAIPPRNRARIPTADAGAGSPVPGHPATTRARATAIEPIAHNRAHNIRSRNRVCIQTAAAGPLAHNRDLDIQPHHRDRVPATGASA